MRYNERGGVSLIGMLLAMLGVLLLVYLITQSRGLFGRGGEEGGPDPMDQARIATAIAELSSVKTGLVLYNRNGRFPSTSEINTLEDLRQRLADLTPLQPEPAFTFESYTSAHPDTFVLITRAMDSAHTPLLLTPTVGPRVTEIPPSP
jgi:hypothetical protein